MWPMSMHSVTYSPRHDGYPVTFRTSGRCASTKRMPSYGFSSKHSLMPTFSVAFEAMHGGYGTGGTSVCFHSG